MANEHDAGAVNVLLTLRAARFSYPPARDAETTAASLRAWLHTEHALGRWVALNHDRVVGHVQVTTAPPALLTQLAGVLPEGGPVLAEVGKLFVALGAQHAGTGGMLLQHAVRFAHFLGMRPVLTVRPTSAAAILLSRRSDWVNTGLTTGDGGPYLVILGPAPRAAALPVAS
ncbi:MAG: GNAT family N-acetyltransferase [Propionicimonas sp.]